MTALPAVGLVKIIHYDLIIRKYLILESAETEGKQGFTQVLPAHQHPKHSLLTWEPFPKLFISFTMIQTIYLKNYKRLANAKGLHVRVWLFFLVIAAVSDEMVLEDQQTSHTRN